MFRKYVPLLTAIVFVFCFVLPSTAQDTMQRILSRRQDTATVNELIKYGLSLLPTDHKMAGKVFTTALEQSRHLHYDYGIGTAYSRLGFIEGQEGRPKGAIAYNLKALSHFKKAGNVKGIATCYNNVGCNYDILGMGDRAIHYYIEGIKILEEHRTEDWLLSMLYSNTGTLYCNRKEITKAIFYSKKGADLANSIRDTARLIIAYTSLSNVYLNADDNNNGLKAAKKALQFINANSDPMLQARAYMYIGASYLGLNKADPAIEALQRSMRYAATSDVSNYIPAGIYLADAYHLKKDYTQQRKVLEQLVEKSEANNNLLYNYDLYGRLAELNDEKGNFKEAYDYNVKYNLLKDSFYTQQNYKTVQEIEARYQTAQKEKALSQKQLQLSEKNLALEKSNRYILFAVSGFVIAILLASGIYLQSQNKKKAYQSKLQTLQKEKEIDMLSALMQGEEKERTRIAKDLHDGVAGMLAAVKMHFNSLVYQYESLPGAKGYQQGIELLNEATLEVRKTSHNLMPEVLIRHGLDEALARYCSNISNSNMLIVQYDSWGEPPRFKSNFELSIYRIVQELLNNILKHSKATEALVQMSYQNDLLSITIEDNGIGFDQSSSQADGIGLHSLQNRIKAINGEMEVETEPGRGVSVYMEFETSGLVVENRKEQPLY